MEPNFCMENGLKTMETMDSMINIGGYGIWEWGINWKSNEPCKKWVRSEMQACLRERLCPTFYLAIDKQRDETKWNRAVHGEARELSMAKQGS